MESIKPIDENWYFLQGQRRFRNKIRSNILGITNAAENSGDVQRDYPNSFERLTSIASCAS
jgi:hypothetical protein